LTAATPEPKSPPYAATSEPIPMAPPQVSTLSEDLNSIHKSIKDLTSRLSRIENAIIRLEMLEKKINANSDAPNQSALVRKLESKIEEIESNLSDSLSYKIRRKFECGHCHTKGFVAVNIRCTKCGKETWSGWYPKKS
jgi:predicted  nucleic acid-binding Zn-ribbon protein